MIDTYPRDENGGAHIGTSYDSHAPWHLLILAMERHAENILLFRITHEEAVSASLRHSATISEVEFMFIAAEKHPRELNLGDSVT